MRNENKKTKGVEMKVTFNTLKKYARKGHLFHNVRGEFSGMVDGIEFTPWKKWSKTSLENLAEWKVTKNYIQVKSENKFSLSNCCFYVDFELVILEESK
jgi:hypothetical protein|tara:strand:- start:411 stop:707 length:297 start_codon:yes stop_codon:yes gene_type:complete